MSSMNQRFRKLVGSTRRSSSNQSINSNPAANSSTTTLPRNPQQPATNGSSPSPAANPANPSTAQTPPGPPSTAAPAPATASTSSTSLAMNQQPLGRPPSYQYANAGTNNLATPQHQGRPTSPMPPPPINTGGGHGYPPQSHQPMYGQPAPPGYPMQQQAYGYGAPQPAGPHSYQRNLAEVEGSNRSKAQLIVGIDFVR